MSELLPLVDISPLHTGPSRARDELAAEVDHLLRTAGFLMIVGHRVPDELRTATREAARAFFHQPDHVKERVRIAGDRGWMPTGYEAVGYASGDPDSRPDLKESFSIGPEPIGVLDWLPPNRLPDGPAGFVPTMRAYAAEMHRLGADLFRLFALALGLPEQYFTERSQHPVSLLSVNWYPAFDRIGPAQPNQFRIGPHTDYGGVTILDRQPGHAGLQIQTLDGTWVDAPVYPGAYTINVADLLARCTGDRWRSTPHRVLPPDPAAPAEELISLVFFHELDHDVVVETLPPPIGGGAAYEPVRCWDYLMDKFAAVTIG